MKSSDFRVTFGKNQQQFAPELTSFMKGVFFLVSKNWCQKNLKKEKF